MRIRKRGLRTQDPEIGRYLGEDTRKDQGAQPSSTEVDAMGKKGAAA